VVDRALLEARLRDPELKDEELHDVVRSIIDALELAQPCEPTLRAIRKCDLIDLLGKAAARSDAAVARLVEALGDADGYDPGSSPYDSYWESVAEHALQALYPTAARARSLPFLVEGLEQRNVLGRSKASRVLEWIGPPAVAALPVLERLATDADPSVRVAATAAIRRIRGVD
jgi:hypothetical protein